MICNIHNRFFPQNKCPLCEREEKELMLAIRIAEQENKEPIVIWEGQKGRKDEFK